MVSPLEGRRLPGGEQRSPAPCLRVGPADAAHGLRRQQFKPRSLGREKQLLVNPAAEQLARLQLWPKRSLSLH